MPVGGTLYRNQMNKTDEIGGDPDEGGDRARNPDELGPIEPVVRSGQYDYGHEQPFST